MTPMAWVLQLCAVLLALAAIGVRGDSACSRFQSKRAKELLDVFVFPEIAERSFELPADCPLRPELDQFALLNAKKTFVRSNLWQCGLCPKQFKSESFLDRHMSSRHADAVPKNATVCLANYCDMLACDAIDEDENGAPLLAKKKACQPADIERKQSLCKAVVHKCFPPERGPVARSLHDAMVTRLCKAIACAPDGRQLGVGSQRESKSSGTMRRLYWVLVGILLLIMALFYVAMFVYKSDKTYQKDLRRLKATRQESRLAFWRKEKPKLF